MKTFIKLSSEHGNFLIDPMEIVGLAPGKDAKSFNEPGAEIFLAPALESVQPSLAGIATVHVSGPFHVRPCIKITESVIEVLDRIRLANADRALHLECLIDELSNADRPKG